MSEMVREVGSTLGGLRRELEIVTHNLANVNTVGYKRRCNSFSKILMAEEDRMKAGSDKVFSSKVNFDFSQGSIIGTERTLDIALKGKGFFVIETPSGPLYTRSGNFHLNASRQIVDSLARTVAGEAGPITVPPDVGVSQIHISNDGNISADSTAVGKFQLVDFKEDENKLFPVGTNCFKVPKGIKPVEAENLILNQGYQETSNVKMVEELVDLMMVTKLYEANIKFIEARRQTANSIISVAMG